jgi:two-component system, LytTR family, sensor kinase
MEVVDLICLMRFYQTLARYKIHHFFFWMVVAVVWYYLRYQDYSASSTAWKVTVVKTVDLALLVYICNYLLIPKLLYKRHYLLFVLAFICLVAGSSFYKMSLIGKITDNRMLSNWSINLKGRIYDNVIPHFFLVIAGVAVKLMFDHFKMQQTLIRIAREKAETELSFLKSQINPHFLFNSLNSVYFLIDKNNVEARAALHKFSDMLRYQLYEIKDRKIPIEKEVSYLEDYISLQQLRNDQCSIQVRLLPGTKSFQIEPLLLIPFVENAFKHLSHFSDGRQNEIRIDLTRENGEMNFAVRNTTEGKQLQVYEAGGIGLANVKRRLELLYPQKHQLLIEEKQGWFGVELKIKIEDHDTH